MSAKPWSAAESAALQKRIAVITRTRSFTGKTEPIENRIIDGERLFCCRRIQSVLSIGRNKRIIPRFYAERKEELKMVFYFAETGSSRYAAEQMEEKTISIQQVMGQERGRTLLGQRK